MLTANPPSAFTGGSGRPNAATDLVYFLLATWGRAIHGHTQWGNHRLVESLGRR
jgi:hypothetical protein